MRTARITLHVALREDYPWKPGQPPLEDSLAEAAADGLRWLDCVEGSAEVWVQVLGDHPLPTPRRPWWVFWRRR
jgi:hypothetical protein